MNNEFYGEFIKNNREALNMSQKELARKLNVSEATISKWENNYMKPDINNIVSLSYMFGISVNDFFNKKYNDGFSIEDKYPILKCLDMICNNQTYQFFNESNGYELLHALKTMYSLLKKKKENNISNVEKDELNNLLNGLVHSLAWEKYYEKWENTLTGIVEEKTYIEEGIRNPTSEDVFRILNQKEDNIINIHFVYNFYIQELLINIKDKKLINALLRYANRYNDGLDLRTAMEKKNMDLVLVYLLNGYKLENEKAQKILINDILEYVGD